MDAKAKIPLKGMILVVSIALFVWYMFGPLTGNVTRDPLQDPYPSRDGPALTLAHWNLDVFGVTKAGQETLLQDYASLIDDFDIIFIQEIRDKGGSAFQALCALLPQYACKVSNRAGRSSNKEQYGVLYRSISLETGKTIRLVDWHDYTPDPQDRWERPPLAVTFSADDYIFTVYTLHVKPAAVQQELADFETLVADDNGNILLIGDFNADCTYYSPQQEKEFDSWHWIIRDTADTTVAQSSCAYDRAIMNDEALEEYRKKGIVTIGITEAHSDHYLVWVGLEPEETI